MVLNTIGMVLIIISWALQIMPMAKGKMEIRKEFALLQMLGIICIALGTYLGSTLVSVLNLASAAGAGVVFVLLMKKQSLIKH
jgi:hypothetical protein